jgi:hypothetical protein
MIYKLNDDFPNTCLLLIDGVELYTKMPTYKPRFFAKPRLQEWVMPEASFFLGEGAEQMKEDIPDITPWSTGVLVFNPKAYEVFHSYLAKSGEFLPISVYGETYYLFNTLYIIPESAMNKSRAIEVIDTGVHLGQSNVTFDESFLDGEKIINFKTVTDKLMFAYCTEQFKKLYEDNGFKGLVFEPVDHEIGTTPAPQ